MGGWLSRRRSVHSTTGTCGLQWERPDVVNGGSIRWSPSMYRHRGARVSWGGRVNRCVPGKGGHRSDGRRHVASGSLWRADVIGPSSARHPLSGATWAFHRPLCRHTAALMSTRANGGRVRHTTQCRTVSACGRTPGSPEEGGPHTPARATPAPSHCMSPGGSGKGRIGMGGRSPPAVPGRPACAQLLSP